MGDITDRDVSEGRFIITTGKYLDPLIYRSGREITFAGILTGSRKKVMGEAEHISPVFDAKEVYLWREERYYPYPYWYDPFFYPTMHYPAYPFWYRPYLHY